MLFSDVCGENYRECIFLHSWTWDGGGWWILHLNVFLFHFSRLHEDIYPLWIITKHQKNHILRFRKRGLIDICHTVNVNLVCAHRNMAIHSRVGPCILWPVFDQQAYIQERDDHPSWEDPKWSFNPSRLWTLQPIWSRWYHLLMGRSCK